MDLTDRLLIVVSASGSAAISEMDKLEKSAKGTDSAFGNMSKSLKTGLVAGATALVSTGLVSYLQSSVTAYADAAKKAGDLAKATGGSVENVSRLEAALKDAGVSADTASTMLTKFTTGASGKNKKLLDDLNVTLHQGKDGATDYADGMVQAVDSIMKIGDASKRNQDLVALFGKAGAQAFQDMIAAGVPLSEAMKRISENRIFTDEDRLKAQAYDDAVDALSASMEGLQNTVGRTLVPLLSTAADALSTVVDVMLDIPGPVYVAAGAMTAFYVASKSTLVAGLLSEGATLVTGLAVAFRDLSTVKWAELGSGLGTFAKGAGAAGAAMAVLAGVMGSISDAKSLHGLVTSLDSVSGGLQSVADQRRNTDSVFGSVKEFFTEPFWMNGEKMSNAMGNVAHATAVAAEETMNSADASDAAKAAAADLARVIGTGSREQQAANLSTEEGQAAWEKYASALDATALAQQQAADTSKALSDVTLDMVMNGDAATSTWQNLADAAVAANEATLVQKQADELASIAAGQYAVSIQGVVDWQTRLIGLTVDTQTGLNDIQAAYKNAADTMDDPQTWGDEAIIESGKAQQAVWDYVDTLAESGLTSDEIIAKLVELQTEPGATDQLKGDIDGIITALQGKTNEVPVNIASKLDPGAQGKTKAGLDGLVEPREAEVTVDVTNPKGASSLVDDVAHPRTVPMTIDVTNDQGAAWLLDQVAKHRTAVIDIEVRGQQSAARIINGLPQVSTAAPATAAVQPLSTAPSVTNHWSITVNGARDPESTVRAFERWARDNGRPEKVLVTL